MNLFDATVPVFTHKLNGVNGWLDKAVAFAEQKKFDPETLLSARLAPDMIPLVGQIQIACDNVKGVVSRLAGKEAPKHPDTEKTIAELRNRIRLVTDYLGTFKREDFVGAEDREVKLPWLRDGHPMRGGDYLDHYALPNLYFHLATAYGILRHNGVDLGKKEFISFVPFKD